MLKVEMEAKLEQEKSIARKTGADLLIQSLIAEEVEKIFGYPGGAVLPIYDAIYRSDASFQHILSRHEQGSIHAAQGYARVTGKPGVVLSTSGPGATNLVTGIADAMMDSLPIVVFTGQVASGVIGTDAFQESDVMGITTPITKYNYQVRDIKDLPRIVKEAFHIASTGRPGPVVVDIPKDVSSEVTTIDCEVTIDLPGYEPNVSPNPLQLTKLAEAIQRAEKPVILAGAGVLFSGANEALLAFAEKHQIPVANTLLGLGGFPGTHPLALQMAGMHGNYSANTAIYKSDLLINIGARFDDRLTGNLADFAPYATVAHIDIDPAEISKNVPTQIPVVADAKGAVEALLRMDIAHPDSGNWLDNIKENKQNYPLWFPKEKQKLSPQWLMLEVYEKTKGNAIITTDVGQHQMWAAQYYAFNKPNRWVTSGGLGTMGFGFPAAIGAQLGKPDEPVIALVGDGGFQMTLQELAVLKERDLPVKVFIVNNEALGMVRQWQESFYEKRYSESLLTVAPDFVKLAESYDIKGMRAGDEETAAKVISEALDYNGPVVVDFRVIQQENVYPMIAPGKGMHEMLGVKR